LIAARRKVNGTTVYNTEREKLGRVYLVAQQHFLAVTVAARDAEPKEAIRTSHDTFLSDDWVPSTRGRQNTMSTHRHLNFHLGRGSGDLLERALMRCFVRTPAQQPGAMPETVARHVIEPHLNDQFLS
jgi:AcrR family transcriptional regulator